jgi:hypothetical protein
LSLKNAIIARFDVNFELKGGLVAYLLGFGKEFEGILARKSQLLRS